MHETVSDGGGSGSAQSLRAAFAAIRSAAAEHRALPAFAGSNAAVLAVVVVESLLVLRWVDPPMIGIWQAVLLTETYASVSRLGVLNAFNREFPYLVGAGRSADATVVAGTTLSYTLFLCLSGAFSYLVAGTLLSGRGPFWSGAFMAMAVVWAASGYGSYVEATLRSDREFGNLSRAKVYECMARLASLPVVWVLGFGGFCTRAAVLSLVRAVILHRCRTLRAPLVFRLPVFRDLLKTGLPLYGLNSMLTLAVGVESAVLLKLGGASAAGLFAPVAGIVGAMALLPDTLSVYVYPRMSYLLGKSQRATALRRPSLVVLAVAVATSIPVTVLSWSIMPSLFGVGLPRYQAATLAAQIAVAGGVFAGGRAMLTPLICLKRWTPAYGVVAGFLGAKCVLVYSLARYWRTLEGAALGGALAAFGLAILATWAALHAMKGTHSA